MRKILSLAAAAALVLSAAAAATAASGSGTQRYSFTAAAAKANGIALRHSFSNGVGTADLTSAQVAMLQRKGITVEPVAIYTIDDVSVKGKPGGGGGRVLPSTQVPYGIKMIYGNPSLTTSGISGGSGVTVAVLDTGSIAHNDFYRADGSFIRTGCVDFSQRQNPQVEGTCTDGHGHGTHVTGTIAGAGGVDGKGIFGVAPGANIFSYKVLNDQGSGYSDDIAAGIRTAADRGANIISMSLGGSSADSLERDAITYANGKGVLVIAAAGNSGPNADTIGYPGGFKEAVAVAALNPNEVVAYFSSRGITDGNDASIVDREVEVAGPGRDTISTYKDGGYATMSGTSMATPHISGLAAKIWKGSGSTTRSALVTAAKAHDITSAEQVNNAGAGYDIASGYGLPQVTNLKQSNWSN